VIGLIGGNRLVVPADQTIGVTKLAQIVRRADRAQLHRPLDVQYCLLHEACVVEDEGSEHGNVGRAGAILDGLASCEDGFVEATLQHEQQAAG
jgi:hypothetical protein